MDIQKIIGELLEKFNIDTSLIEKFKKDPIATVKSLLGGIDLGGLTPDENQLGAIVEGLKAKLNIEDIAKSAPGIIEKIKGFFGGNK